MTPEELALKMCDDCFELDEAERCPARTRVDAALSRLRELIGEKA